MSDFLVYDVFTREAFGGNQLAIVPDAAALPERDLQRIAREFNFSETCFLFPAEHVAHTAKVRIFTPTMEIPFAGHPVIGTAVALSDLGRGAEQTLELGIGALKCFAQDGAARFTTTAELEKIAEPDVELVAKALGLETSDIALETHRPQMATLGLPFTITELKSREALARIITNPMAFREGASLFPGALDFAQFAYWRSKTALHARMFAPLDNIPEDPATGSACATLAAFLTERSCKDAAYTIWQGEDMGRPSEIHVRTDKGTVTVSGNAKRVMQGRLVY